MAKRAICIGINDYPGTDLDLNGCVNDAKDWAGQLRTRGYAVTFLLDRQATGAAIRQAIRATLAQTTARDSTVIQYSGHGSYIADRNGDEADGRDECVCPHDVMTKGPIVDDELFELYSARHPKSRLFVVSDSCHSGTVARFMPISLPASTRGRHAPRRLVRFLPPGTFLSKPKLAPLEAGSALRRSSQPGRHAGLLLAACQDAQYSYDAVFAERPNGAFTYVALKTLRELPGSATYADWFKHIRRALPSQQFPQTPNLFGATSMKAWRVLA